MQIRSDDVLPARTGQLSAGDLGQLLRKGKASRPPGRPARHRPTPTSTGPGSSTRNFFTRFWVVAATLDATVIELYAGLFDWK